MNWSYPPQFVKSLQVSVSEIDVLGHVNNQVYLDWMINIANAHAQAVGLDLKTQSEFGKVMVARQHEMNFLASCFVEDELMIGTWIGEAIGCCQRKRHYEIFRVKDQKKVFSGHTVWACMQLKNYKPCRLPRHYIDAYQTSVTQ